MERAQKVHKEAIIIDMLEALYPPRDIGYFDVAINAGVTAIHATIPDVFDDLSAAITRIAQFYQLVESIENVKIVSTVAGIESAKKEGKVAIIPGMQDCIPFERNLVLTRIFHKIGLRVIQLTYDIQNYLGGGNVEPVDSGLTSRGKEVVEELNRLGILIDVSHCGEKTSMDAALASKAPIAITHATPLTLVEVRRAKSDTLIKTIAGKGGVIGQVIIAPFNERRDKMGMEVTLCDYVDMLDYLVNLAGIDHVGLGMDLVPFWTKEEWNSTKHRAESERRIYPHKMKTDEEKYCKPFKDISDTIRITEELVKHGYSDNDIKKILGGNWLRLLKEVWKE